ncbi:myosin-binding striated muscle assembly central-domain-containing protein [Ampelomyces quisqualis]|uniref:Myosin-binding striated muscle assembly central-domain-containing protein n=1 Tax=Ampelomyces quisqualis TaxID=50730 RepID=A0A6A5Q7E5_AMPQU|nr:myosin-binding striated muscle assembly central-domain-containing protein [Ampelomyces quisqualis]
MATTSAHQRALELAQKAGESTKAADLASAARFLREASAIAPEHPSVKDAWTKLRQEEDKSELLALCRVWVQSKDEDDGDRALRAVQKQPLQHQDARQAMEILFEFKGEDDVLDQVTGELLRNVGAQTWLAAAVREQPTRIYYEMFERGDDSIDGLLTVLLNRGVWPDDEAFKNGHRDVFMLSLAMMMEEALEHPERAMKGIAQLLAYYADDLKGIIDADSFDVILASLDIRLPSSLRSQATLASIKLFELAPEKAGELISKFVEHRVKKGGANDLIIAFSAATAIFPVAVTAAAALFLTEGFVSTLVPLVEKKKSQKLEQAMLELISAACVDKNCRDAINKHCREWLEELVAESLDKKRANLAALVLVKLGEEVLPTEGPQIVTPGKVDQSDLIASFKSMVIGGDNASKQDSIEGLAYASLQPKVRQDLSESPKFLKRLIGTMSEPSTPSNIVFGGLTIFVNMTAYLPIQSEEEKRMAQLKAYANANVQKPTAPSELMEDANVSVRCKRVLEAGLVPVLVQICKKGSPTILSQSAQILLSLSKEAKCRGSMAQQGAVKLLIQMWDRIANTGAKSTTGTTPYPPSAAPCAAQALSRLLISINPAHVFNAGLPSTSAIRPLSSQLTRTESSGWQLNAFESLLALTNLASLDLPTQEYILRVAFDVVVDDMLLGNHTMLRRGATELLCNLMASPTCVGHFIDPSTPRAQHRLHMLLAMSDVDDRPTRSAAGGALAVLLGSMDEAVTALLAQDKGVEFLLGLCADEDEEVRYRGVVCVRSVVESREGRERVVGKGGVEVLRGLVRGSVGGRVRGEAAGVGVEALQVLGADYR